MSVRRVVWSILAGALVAGVGGPLLSITASFQRGDPVFVDVSNQRWFCLMHHFGCSRLYNAKMWFAKDYEPRSGEWPRWAARVVVQPRPEYWLVVQQVSGWPCYSHSWVSMADERLFSSQQANVYLTLHGAATDGSISEKQAPTPASADDDEKDDGPPDDISEIDSALVYSDNDAHLNVIAGGFELRPKQLQRVPTLENVLIVPCIIRWRGLAANWVIFAVAGYVAAGVLGFAAPRLRAVLQPGRCPKCGYSRRGLRENICPECGVKL